jgi:hypothetical protein
MRGLVFKTRLLSPITTPTLLYQSTKQANNKHQLLNKTASPLTSTKDNQLQNMHTNLGPLLATRTLESSDPNWPDMTELVIPHLVFAERIVDLSGCRFLKVLDIQGCQIHLYLSKNKGLVELLLPPSLQHLHIRADQPLKFLFPACPLDITETHVSEMVIEYTGKHPRYVP